MTAPERTRDADGGGANARPCEHFFSLCCDDDDDDATPRPSAPMDRYAERGSLQAVADAADGRGNTQPWRKTPSTHFVGSSSGIYFNKTVLSSFAPSSSASTTGAFDQVFVLSEDDPNSKQASKIEEADTRPESLLPFLRGNAAPLPTLGRGVACARRYFKTWHHLLPMIDGKAFLADLRCLLSPFDTLDRDSIDRRARLSASYAYTATVRAVLSMAQTTVDGPSEWSSRELAGLSLTSAGQVLCYLPHLIAASHHDNLGAIQAVLALELYLVVTFRLRAAHQLGAIAVRLAQDAGLHRCPSRYAIFAKNPASIGMRKRIWFSLVSLDRFTTQQLGMPFAVHEDDFDVCPIMSVERHAPPSSSSSADWTTTKTQDDELEAMRQEAKCATLQSFASLQRLNARCAEIFNQNIEQRNVDDSQVASLRIDLERWWNELRLGDDVDDPLVDGQRPAQGSAVEEQSSFFRVGYHQALLNLERPTLSQQPGLPAFQLAIQSAIRSACEIVKQLHRELSPDSAPSRSGTPSLATCWPGFVNAAYLSALVLAYAARNDEFNRDLATRYLNAAVAILDAFGRRWKGAKSHASVAKMLLEHVGTWSGSASSRARKRPLSAAEIEEEEEEEDQKSEHRKTRKREAGEKQAGSVARRRQTAAKATAATVGPSLVSPPAVPSAAAAVAATDAIKDASTESQMPAHGDGDAPPSLYLHHEHQHLDRSLNSNTSSASTTFDHATPLIPSSLFSEPSQMQGGTANDFALDPFSYPDASSFFASLDTSDPSWDALLAQATQFLSPLSE